MSLLNILILVGAIQGFISAVLLFNLKKGNTLSNKLLAGIILCFSTACLNIFLMLTGFRYQSAIGNLIAYVVPFLIVMPIGPLMYFYTRSLLHPEFTLSPKHRLHFTTVIVDLFPYMVGVFWVAGWTLGYFRPEDETNFRSIIDQYQTYSDIMRWSSITLYIYHCRNLVEQYQEITSPSVYRWIKQVILVMTFFQALWLAHLIPYLLPVFRETLISLVDWYPIYIPLAVMVYWLGVNGYFRNPETHELVLGRKREGNVYAPSVMEKTKVQIRESMERDRLFLNPSLTVEHVARHVGTTSKIISATLNQHLGKSFNEFINAYRVEELKRRLTESGNEHLTIMGLALECGFNSQATMQRAFRALTNQSPREFLAKQKFNSATPA
jgi:AraC-like DNA-binding protein